VSFVPSSSELTYASSLFFLLLVRHVKPVTSRSDRCSLFSVTPLARSTFACLKNAVGCRHSGIGIVFVCLLMPEDVLASPAHAMKRHVGHV
jgi:hypothetical protein